MPKYLLSYKGNAGQPHTQEDGAKVMAAWGQWIGSVGAAMVDAGNPTGTSKVIAANGAVSDSGADVVSGYSVIEAADIDAAIKLTKGCPHLAAGNPIEVGELIAVM